MPLGAEVDLRAGHIVLDGFPALRERRTASPLLDPCLLWPRSPISATAQLLLLRFIVKHDACFRLLLVSLFLTLILSPEK